MIRGRCLCGAVQFELARVTGPFELCHCSRCRRVSGSAFMASVGARRADFRWLQGRERIKTYDAPLLSTPPAYRSCFCEQCGSPVPDPNDESPAFELAAGLLEGELGVRPDKHIFVDKKASWFELCDALPQLDEDALIRLRERHPH